MKHKDLIKSLEKQGYYFLRNGGSHDLYSNGKKNIAVPRHREINEMLAKKILKDIGL